MSSDLPRAGRLIQGSYLFPLRVYYEDTDAAGIVYYANYLKFAERARTEWLRHLGLEQEKLRDRDGIAFVVRRAAIEFLSPARLDDELVVATRVSTASGATLDLDQEVRRDATSLVRLSVLIACIGRNGRPVRLPPELKAALASHFETSRMVKAHAR